MITQFIEYNNIDLLQVEINLKKADRILEEFITECFTPKGKHQDKEHPKIVSKLCEWCPFNDNKELCNKHVSS